MTSVSRNHFLTIVDDWSHFGPPLRPSPEETAVIQRTIDALTPPVDAIILGVTPETAACTWPSGTTLRAIDHSSRMIDLLWKPQPGLKTEAIVADWRSIPIAASSIDIVTGDSSYNLFDYPDGFNMLTQEVDRVLRKDGRFVTRVFLRPAAGDSLDRIAEDLRAGDVHSVHALKLRLYAALHGVDGNGTRLGDVWTAWKSLPPLPSSQLGQTGWTDAELTGIERYRDLDTRYYLPSLSEMRAALTTHFGELEYSFGRHNLGDRCATFVASKS